MPREKRAPREAGSPFDPDSDAVRAAAPPPLRLPAAVEQDPAGHLALAMLATAAPTMPTMPTMPELAATTVDPDSAPQPSLAPAGLEPTVTASTSYLCPSCGQTLAHVEADGALVLHVYERSILRPHTLAAAELPMDFRCRCGAEAHFPAASGRDDEG